MHKHKAGSLAMAHKGANTNGSQFYIITGSNGRHLDGKHVVFGEVDSGMGVVLKIDGTCRHATVSVYHY